MNQQSNEKDSNEHQSLGKIDKVDPATQFHKQTDNKWVSVLKEFNALGSIADVYAKSLAYKIESKRLKIELQRVEEQSKIANNIIDKTFILKMEELQQRRIALMGFYQTVNAQLERTHIERMEVLEMAQLAQKKSFETGLPIEERKMYTEMAIEMTNQLPKFAGSANESLQKLVNALPPVQISQKLLT